MRVRSLLIVFVAAAAVAAFVVLPTGAQTNGDSAPTWQHAAKFLCGSVADTSGEFPVLPGRYATAINVHNPNLTAVKGSGTGGPSTDPAFSPTFRKKALLLLPRPGADTAVGEIRTEPGPWVRPPSLRSDWGFEIDCPDIRRELLEDDPRAGATFIKGYVVIEALGKLPLDVVVTYTHQRESGGEATAQQGLPTVSSSMDVETVEPKMIRSG